MLKIKRIYRPPVFDTATTFESTIVKHKMNILYVSVFRKSGAQCLERKHFGHSMASYYFGLPDKKKIN